MSFKTLQQAQEYLYSFSDEKNTSSQGGKNFSFGRTQHLANQLGNPQNNIKVIHIVGTSGKGSTTRILSHLLHAHGLKVGSSISPHLVDFRERFQINNSLLSVGTLCSYIEEIKPILENMRTSRVGSPTYFEVTIMLAYYIFWKEKVDYAVMETGMGGRLDATNAATSPSKVAVFTRIGLDHTEFLGNTLEKIATEKAAIIHTRNIVISIKQSDEVDGVIDAQAKKQQSLVRLVVPNETFSHVATFKGGNTFHFQYEAVHFDTIQLSIEGAFQVENSSVALATLIELSKRDRFTLNESAIRSTLQTMTSPGRFETFIFKGKMIILDGAHNPQKMSAFIESLKTIYPNKRFDFLLGFKKGKDYATMLQSIIPLASTIYTTSFINQQQTHMIHPEPVATIADTIKQMGKNIPIYSYDDPCQALTEACKDTSGMLVITGSLYLISELYQTIRGTLSH